MKLQKFAENVGQGALQTTVDGHGMKPRELPNPAPDHIDLTNKLAVGASKRKMILKKIRQSDDMVVYINHIKGRPTFIFVMAKFTEAAAIQISGFLNDRRGLVLADRDGVLKDSRFLNEANKQQAADAMIPSALEASKRLDEAGIGLGVVTNQGGYQTGKMSFDDTVAINVRVSQQLANAGGHVDAIFICPFTTELKDPPEGTHDARKPASGMPLYAKQLAAASQVPVLGMIGDQRTDGAASQGAELRFYAVTDAGGRWEAERVDAARKGVELPALNTNGTSYEEVPAFADAVEAILTRFARSHRG